MLSYLSIVFSIFLVLDSSKAFSLTKNEPESTLIVKEGDSFRLNCDVDNYYEYCLFRHNKDICDFEWKRDYWNITIADCKDYEDRMEWSGNYDYYGCGITIKNAKFEDSGLWSCEIESYAAGKYRGYGYNATAEMEIKVVPKDGSGDSYVSGVSDGSGDYDGSGDSEGYGESDAVNCDFSTVSELRRLNSQLEELKSDLKDRDEEIKSLKEQLDSQNKHPVSN